MLHDLSRSIFSLCVLAALCAADMSVAQTTQPAQEQSAEPQAQRQEQDRSDRRRGDGERRRRSIPAARNA